MGDAGDAHDLARFLAAQDGIYPQALAEVRAGAKRSHWMWFVFPQFDGLGHSATARCYAIRSLGEARAYLAHPVLGPRYRECLSALQALPRTDADRVFGSVDAMKLRSSLTLFAEAGEDAARHALERWFDAPDPATMRLLAERG